MGKKGREVAELNVNELVKDLNTAVADEWNAFYQYWICALIAEGVDAPTVAELGEMLPVDDKWADVVISNGVVNLCPDKLTVFREMHRALKPGGRLQIADILVEKPVPEEAKRNIDLWTG